MNSEIHMTVYQTDLQKLCWAIKFLAPTGLFTQSIPTANLLPSKLKFQRIGIPAMIKCTLLGYRVSLTRVPNNLPPRSAVIL